MDQPRLFISYSTVDHEFTKRLVEDLKGAGADVRVSYERIATGNFARTINEGLGTCD